jgi:hypothetical protein
MPAPGSGSDNPAMPSLRTLLLCLAALVASLLLGAALTLLLLPLWTWVEAFTGVESIGHSGPATWCFVVTSAVLFAGWLAWQRRHPRR